MSLWRVKVSGFKPGTTELKVLAVKVRASSIKTAIPRAEGWVLEQAARGAPLLDYPFAFETEIIGGSRAHA